MGGLGLGGLGTGSSLGQGALGGSGASLLRGSSSTDAPIFQTSPGLQLSTRRRLQQSVRIVSDADEPAAPVPRSLKVFTRRADMLQAIRDKIKQDIKSESDEGLLFSAKDEEEAAQELGEKSLDDVLNDLQSLDVSDLDSANVTIARGSSLSGKLRSESNKANLLSKANRVLTNGTAAALAGYDEFKPIPITTNKKSFFPADYYTNDGFCPWLSRKRRDLGHFANCSALLRRPPRNNELTNTVDLPHISMRKDETLKDSQGDLLRIHMKADLIASLPREDPNWHFKSCAVVGNSGSLAGSGFGKEIDSRDAVFRMNMAPTEGFEQDVGSRTSFDFINQQHTKTFIPRVRAGGRDPESARAPLRNSTLVVFEVTSPFARYHLYHPLLRRFNENMRHAPLNPNSGVNVQIVSPELTAHTYRVWGKLKRAIEMGSAKAGFASPQYLLKPMTGFFATIFAIQSCEHVHLYGFSPYRKQGTGVDQVRYHYFDDVSGVTRHHSFDLAFEMFRMMSVWPCAGAAVTVHE